MAQERTGGRLPPHNAEAEQSVLGCMLPVSYTHLEYAVLIDLSEGCDCEHEHAEGEACDCEDGCGERDVYIMKVVTSEETEEFMPVPDELFDTVAAIAQKRLEEAAEDEEESID